MSLSGILDYIYFEKGLDDIADEYSSYKRWIIDKLGAGGLSSSQNCKTLPLPYIIFIKKGGASSWNS